MSSQPAPARDVVDRLIAAIGSAILIDSAGVIAFGESVVAGLHGLFERAGLGGEEDAVSLCFPVAGFHQGKLPVQLGQGRPAGQGDAVAGELTGEVALKVLYRIADGFGAVRRGLCIFRQGIAGDGQRLGQRIDIRLRRLDAGADRAFRQSAPGFRGGGFRALLW